MNELDLIRSFRADAAAPSTAARARARRAWEPQERRRRSGLPVRRLALGAGGLALTIAAGLALLGGDGGRLATSDARAADTLRTAAGQAQAHGLRAPRRGEYAYFRSRQAQRSSAGGYAWIQPSIRELWVGAGGALRTRVSALPIEFAGPGARERWEAAGRPDLSWLPPVETHRFPTAGKELIHFGGSGLTYPQLLALPTDPPELYRRIRAAAEEAGGDHPIEDRSFTIVSDVLRLVPLPGELRAAFFRAAALIPGIGYTDRVRDLAGRTGIGIWSEDASGRNMLIFEPGTYRLLGSREGSMFSAAFIEEGITGSDRERPAGGSP
jgi:hypothetical protein